MKTNLLICLFFLSLVNFSCDSAEPYECPEGYSEKLISSLGFNVCLPNIWTGEEMERLDPVSGEKMIHYIYREDPTPGKSLVGFEKFDFWGFEDDFQTFNAMTVEDAKSLGQDLVKVVEGNNKNGVPYWMTELAYSEGGEEVVAQNYYFFPEEDYSRTFIMRAFCLKEAFEACQDTFAVVSASFSY